MNPIKEQISQLIQDAHNGEESGAKAYAALKEIIDVAQSGTKVLLDLALSEAREFNKNEVYYGGTWEVRNTATYLDFSKDEIFTELNSKALQRKKDLNQAWKAKQDGKFYASEDGEEIPVLPVKTPSKETLIFNPKS